MIKCSQRDQTSYLKPGHCAFQHSSSNDTMVAACPYFFRHSLLENWLLQLPKRKNDLNTFMCENLNREVGEDICGKCKNGTGPNIYSAGSECTKCSAWNIVYYLTVPPNNHPFCNSSAVQNQFDGSANGALCTVLQWISSIL